MKKTLVLTLVLVIAGCSPVITRQQSNLATDKLPLECKGLNDLVNNGFFRVEKYNYFIAHPTTYSKLVAKNDCVSKLSPTEIRLIFGEPSFETKKGLYYNLTTQQKGEMIINGLIFYKTNEDTIEKAEIRAYTNEKNK